MGYIISDGIVYSGGGGGGASSADKVSLDDTNLSYEADDVQEAFEKVTKSLTYAEYKALTEEEKNNGTIYLITDVNGDGQSFQPVIYSTEEREIGVWKDGKPLYAIVLVNAQTVSLNNMNWTNLTLENQPANIDTFAFGALLADAFPSSYEQLRVIYDKGTSKFKMASIQSASFLAGRLIYAEYTKTTDTAGSGQWTPQGVPAVHYSEEEQIIGTWIDGKTLYEKTLKVDNISIDTAHATEIADLTALNIGTFVCVSHSVGYLHAYDTTVNENRLSVGYLPTSKKLVAGQSYTQQYTTVDILTTIRYTKSST